MPLYLGVDGGGSKTTAAIASDTRVLGTATRGGSNAVRLPEATVRASMHAAILEACERARVKPSAIEFACIGAAGSAQPRVREKIQEIVGEIVKSRIEVVGDMNVAHAGAFFGAPGVVVIAGTGSIAFALNSRGETLRAGGWGSAISDEGSGYWIGRRAVSAALRALDSAGDTSLITRVMRLWNIEVPTEMSKVAHGTPAPDFATMFPEVQAAAAEGDPTALEILSAAGSELATLAKIAMRRMWPDPQSVDIAMVGSIFRYSPIVRKVFYDSIHSERAGVRVRFCTREPVHGAIYLARRMTDGASTATGGAI